MNEYDVIIPYLIGAVLAIVIAVVVKIISSKIEKDVSVKKTLRCPKCRQTFTAEEKARHFKVRCPHCGTEGRIK